MNLKCVYIMSLFFTANAFAMDLAGLKPGMPKALVVEQLKPRTDLKIKDFGAEMQISNIKVNDVLLPKTKVTIVNNQIKKMEFSEKRDKITNRFELLKEAFSKTYGTPFEENETNQELWHAKGKRVDRFVTWKEGSVALTITNVQNWTTKSEEIHVEFKAID